MHPAEREPASGAGAGASQAVIDRLFELSSESWADRLRRAVAPVALGTLGPYELIAEIGRGGQGEVYKALQPGTRRPIALKRIAGVGLSPDTPARQRFAREVEALTRLSHPNVVTVHAAEFIDRHTLLVMELVEGRPIDEWADARWNAGAGALEDILRAFAAACDGVAHAHQRGVIHRDLKPGNVLVTPEGHAKVVDFGIAKVLDEHAGQTTASNAFMGTLGYAAPERTGRLRQEPDTRTDVYSLGVLLFRILTGREARAADQLHGPSGAAPIPAASRFRPVPRECDWIVATATAYEPERRYQTVDALAGDVRALLAGGFIAAAPPSATYRLRKAVRRHRSVAVAAALIALALLGATIVSAIAAKQARDALARESAALVSAKESERLAQLEAARQGQVSTLMREVLGASGAVGGGRPDITVREALDRAVQARFPESAEARTTMDPLVEATVRAAIGDTYLGIGRYDDALTHLRAADALLSAGAQNGKALHLQALYMMGRCLRALGRSPEAEVVLRRVVAAHRSAGSGSDLALAEALSSLGVALRWQGRTDEAEACYRESLAIFERTEGPDSAGVATASMNIAILLSRRGDHAGALPLARRSVEIRDRAFPGAHPDKSGIYSIFGSILWAAGDTEQGEAYLRKAIALDREMSPGPSAGIAGRLGDLGDRISHAGKHEEAIALLREAAAMCTVVSGPTNGQTLVIVGRLSSALLRAGRYAEAEQACLSATSQELARGPEASALWAELAEARVSLGCEAEAEAAFLRAWELLPPMSEATHATRESLANRIAEFYQTQGKEASVARWRSIAHEG